MIFVTLGTQDKGFERLLKEIDRCINKGIIKDKVIVQAGYTKYESKNMEIFGEVSKDEFEKLMNECSLLITHGGVGSIFDALKRGKKVIAAPRLKKYNEHTNDHQLEIVKEFSKEGYILGLTNMAMLGKIIEKAEHFKPKKYESNRDILVAYLEEYIDKNEKINFRGLINKYHEVIMYLIFGVLTTVISLLVYYGLVYSLLNPNDPLELQIANFISWVAGVTFAYVTNRKFVFESSSKNKVKEATSFVMARVTTLLLDMSIMFIFVTFLRGNDKIFKLISQVLVIILNYVLSKIFVFKKD